MYDLSERSSVWKSEKKISVFDFYFFVTGKFAAAVFRFYVDLSDLVMSAFELAFFSRDGVAIFDAIFKHADIRIAFLADADDNRLAFGDETDAGHLAASKAIVYEKKKEELYRLCGMAKEPE